MIIAAHVQYGICRPLDALNLYGNNVVQVNENRCPIPEGILSFYSPSIEKYLLQLINDRDENISLIKTSRPAYFNFLNSKGRLWRPGHDIQPPPVLTLEDVMRHVENNPALWESMDLFELLGFVKEDLGERVLAELKGRFKCARFATK